MGFFGNATTPTITGARRRPRPRPVFQGGGRGGPEFVQPRPQPTPRPFPGGTTQPVTPGPFTRPGASGPLSMFPPQPSLPIFQGGGRGGPEFDPQFTPPVAPQPERGVFGAPANLAQTRGFFDGVSDFFDDVGGGVSDFFKDLPGNVSGAFQDAFSFLSDTGEDFGNAFANFVGAIPEDATRFITGGANLTGLTGLGGGFFTNAAGQILQMPNPNDPTLLTSVINPLALIQPGNPSNILDSSPLVAQAIEGIIGPATLPSVPDIITGGAGGIADTVTDIGGGVADIVTDVGEGIGDVGEDILDFGGDLLDGIDPLLAILSGVGPLANLPGGLFGSLLSGGGGALQGLLGDIPGLGSLTEGGDIEGAIRESSDELQDAIRDAGPLERDAIIAASQAQRGGLAAALPQTLAGLEAGRDVLRDVRGDITGRLAPSAQTGDQALQQLTGIAGTPTPLSPEATFTPGAAPLTFGADPRSGLAFDQPISTGEQFNFTAEDLANDPGFQFRLEQGQQAIDRSAAARGGLVSGRTLAAAQEFGQGLAATELDRAFNRRLQGFQAREGAFDREFGRGAATFDRNAQEFGQTFARQAQRFDRNQEANELTNRRQFDAFNANENNRLRRDATRLQEVGQRQAGLSAAAGLGGGARNLLAQLDASLSQNLSTAEAAPMLATAANTLEQAQIDSEEFLGLGFSAANEERAIGNVLASEENAIAMARAQMQSQVVALLGALIGTAGALFGGGTSPPAAPAPNLPPVSSTFGVNQPQRGPTLSSAPTSPRPLTGGGATGFTDLL